MDSGSRWAGWAIAHPDFEGMEKRTETNIYYYLPT
jgi:hypothetical protein